YALLDPEQLEIVRACARMFDHYAAWTPAQRDYVLARPRGAARANVLLGGGVRAAGAGAAAAGTHAAPRFSMTMPQRRGAGASDQAPCVDMCADGAAAAGAYAARAGALGALPPPPQNPYVGRARSPSYKLDKIEGVTYVNPNYVRVN